MTKLAEIIDPDGQEAVELCYRKQRGNNVWRTNDPAESPDAPMPSFTSNRTRTEAMI